MRYFSNKVKFPDNEEFTTLELPVLGVERARERDRQSETERARENAFPEVCKAMKSLG